MTAEDTLKYDTADNCHICREKHVRHIPHWHNENEEDFSMCEVNSRADIIERDHCHILDHFRGAANHICNLKYVIKKTNWKLPIFFHNLRGYDGHLLIRALKKRHGNVRIIPTNMERYLAISVGRVQFLGSFQFTMKSLDALASPLNDRDFVETRKVFGVSDRFNLMRKKVFLHTIFSMIFLS